MCEDGRETESLVTGVEAVGEELCRPQPGQLLGKALPGQANSS